MGRLLALGCALSVAALAQTSQNIVQKNVSLALPVSFDVAASGLPYPPPAFPAYYPATNPSNSVVQLDAYNAEDKPWALVMKTLPFGAGGPLLDQIEYRVNGGDWLRAGGVQIVSLRDGVGWTHFDVEFRVRLNGSEAAGRYQTTLVWQLTPQ